ncbi:MAG: glycosyltransferase family 2 protein [Elusimicrobiota bacterium]|nr:glycosyltransferase family 2 protein [Elusimicrobiota bacterium]
MSAKPYLSALIPVYNEEENLAKLGEEVSAALDALGKPYEVILVDDGSKDRSYEELLKLVKKYPGFKTLRFARNAGQTAAMLAGIQHATGEVIVCLDADMQNDARDIPKLLAKLDEGYDVVSGWRKDRQDRFLDRKLPSMIANGMISKVTGVHLHDYGCTLKLYKAEFLKPLRLYGEMHRFVPALAGFLGARVAEVPVNHRARTAGVSKYGISRTFKVLLDLMTVKFMDQFLGKPIYLFGGGGVGMGLLGVAFALQALYKKFYLGIFVKDQPLFQVSIFCLLIGFQMVLIGLLAEILTRIYYDLKDMRPYFVRETAGF